MIVINCLHNLHVRHVRVGDHVFLACRSKSIPQGNRMSGFVWMGRGAGNNVQLSEHLVIP